jgi:hypothetical protein
MHQGGESILMAAARVHLSAMQYDHAPGMVVTIRRFFADRCPP